MTTEDSRELPPLPEPELLKLPGGDGYDDAAPVKWAWFAHGYDTGMEPFFSDDQMRAYAFAASAGRSELLEALKELDSAETLVNSLSEEMPAAYFAAWDRRNDAWKAARSLIAKHTPLGVAIPDVGQR